MVGSFYKALSGTEIAVKSMSTCMSAYGQVYIYNIFEILTDFRISKLEFSGHHSWFGLTSLQFVVTLTKESIYAIFGLKF